ncbi:MAG: hypothetical protein JNJ47_07380 [Alphaproteobacteria bacterium]|nr:hypothetical protein [Alphaproteobacteria bacterium]
MKLGSKLLLTTTTVFYLASPLLAVNELGEDENTFHNLPQSTPKILTLQPKIPFSDLERAIEIQHSNDFKGSESLDMQIVMAHRQNHACFNGYFGEAVERQHFNDFNGKVEDAFLSFDDPAIYPLAQKLEHFLVAYSEKNLTHQPTKRFIREIQFQRENQDISLLWLLGMHLRFVASISHITPDQRNLFAHVTLPELIFWHA